MCDHVNSTVLVCRLRNLFRCLIMPMMAAVKALSRELLRDQDSSYTEIKRLQIRLLLKFSLLQLLHFKFISMCASK